MAAIATRPLRTRAARALPGASVVLAAVALWAATGVAPDQIARALGYELGFVLVPGLLLLRAISPEARSPLVQLAFGWPLGLLAEVAFFAATAALDARDLFFAYPLLVAVPAALVWRLRARRDGPGDSAASRVSVAFGPAQAWALAGLCLFFFAYVGLTLFARSPIPGSVPEVQYDPDGLFHIAIAAEALRDWPLSSAAVSGLDLNYHYFVHLHLAATSQVTGIELPIVYFRLYLLPLIALVLAQLSLAGRAISGRAWAGPLAAGLFLAVWEIDLVTPTFNPWLGLNPILVWNSPSHTYALAFLIPLALLSAGLISDRIRVLAGIGARPACWVLMAALALVAAGAKGAALPVLVGGWVVYGGWRLLAGRGLDKTVLAGTACCLLPLLASVSLLYGTEGGGLRLAPGGSYELTPALVSLKSSVPDWIPAEVAFWGAGSIAATLLLFAPPLLGLYWILGRARPGLRDDQRLALGFLATGAATWLLLSHVGGSQTYFGFFAVAMAMPWMAEGLLRGLGPWARGALGPRRPVALLVAAWLAALVAAAFAAWQLTLDGRVHLAYLVAYAPFVVGLLAAFAWTRPSARRALGPVLIALMVLGAAGMDAALDTVPETARKLRDGLPLYNDYVRPGVTPEEIAGASWIERNLPEDAVLAVSNQTTPGARRREALNLELPAFAERTTFNEGPGYSVRAQRIGFEDVLAGRAHPYPERRRLERRLFLHGDLCALERMQRAFGVTHLVVMRRTGAAHPRALRAGRVVYRNSAMVVIELGSARDCR